MQSGNKQAAVELARRGFRIFPCNAKKKPLINGWQQCAISSPLQIEATWDANTLPAIPCGANGLAVIDCDRKPAKSDGVAAFTALCAQYGIDLSKAFVVGTPSGGLHFYWRTNAPYGNSSGLLPDGIDVRGIGGYAIAPGATLPDGRSYRLVGGSWDSIPMLPEPLAALLRPKQAQADLAHPMPAADHPGATERELQYAESALQDEIEKLAAMGEGSGRNAALNGAAKRLGEMAGAGWIERGTVERALWDASERNAYRAKDGDKEAWNTLQSGLEAGIKAPRAPLPVIEVPQWLRDSVSRWIEAYRAKGASAVTSLVGFLDSIKSLQEYDIAPVAYLVNGMIPESSLIMFSGGPGSGKSTLVMKIAYLASQGIPVFGTPQRPRRVLYLDRDNAPSIVKDRMTRLRMEPNQRFKYWGGHLGVEVPKRIFADPDLIRWVDRDAVKPIVVIDSQIAFQEGKETDSNDIRAFYDPLRQLTYRGITVIVIHHTGKGESTKEFRGSEDIRAALDVGYVVNNSTKVGLNQLTLSAFKARVIVEEEIALSYSDGEFIPQNLSQAKGDNLTQLLRANPGVTKSEFEKVAMEMRFIRSDVRNFIDSGIGRGSILVKRGDKNATLLYLPETLPLTMPTQQRPS